MQLMDQIRFFPDIDYPDIHLRILSEYVVVLNY
jgi:hypothetical protein